MPSKKDNLPINVEVETTNGGSISYSNEVISIIAGVAANEVLGIAGMCSSGALADIIGRNRNVTRGVRIETGTEEASVDIYIIVEYGYPIQKVAGEVQENVKKAIESMTGLHVVRVDVHVQGVSFEKEKKTQREVLEASRIVTLESSKRVQRIDENDKTAKEEQSKEEPVEVFVNVQPEIIVDSPKEVETDEETSAVEETEQEAKVEEVAEEVAEEVTEEIKTEETASEETATEETSETPELTQEV